MNGTGMAFTGGDKLYHTLKEEYVGISHGKVRDFLAANAVAQKFKPVAGDKIVTVPQASAPMEQCQVDVTQINSSAVGGGHVWIVCIIDIYSRFVCAQLFRHTPTSQDVVKTLDVINSEAVKHDYKFKRLQCDNGSENKDATTAWCTSHGVKQIFNSPYHSTSNGMVERFHRTLKQMIAKAQAAGQTDWAKPTVFQTLIQNYNNSWHSAINAIPYKVWNKSWGVVGSSTTETTKGSTLANTTTPIKDHRYAVMREQRQLHLKDAGAVSKGMEVLVARRAVDPIFRKETKSKVPATESNWTTSRYTVIGAPTTSSTSASRITVVDGDGKKKVVKRSDVQVLPVNKEQTFVPRVIKVKKERDESKTSVAPKTTTRSHRRDREASDLQYAMRHLAPAPDGVDGGKDGGDGDKNGEKNGIVNATLNNKRVRKAPNRTDL
jgi:transposase InsO family protein